MIRGKPQGAFRAAGLFAACMLMLGGVVAGVVGLSGSNAQEVDPSRAAWSSLVRGSYAKAVWDRYVGGLDPATAALAARHDPFAKPEPVLGVESYVTPPNLRLPGLTTEDARRINGYVPFAENVGAAKPFYLKASSSAERARAIRCLTAAIYYEAALEPESGQRAVAQVVLNRVRHPEFPNSVCGVVYQGWERSTGCQFSFTCDGSLLRAPIASIWNRNRQLAEEALNGHVVGEVGTATFYHADYVVPYWRSSLSKVHQVGRHIFYRWPGRVGEPAAFVARYGGNELRLSEAVLTGRAARPLPAPGTLPEGLTVETVVVADASAPGGTTTRVVTSLGGRRQPTAADIASINAKLKAFEAEPAPAAAAPEAPKPSADGVIEVNKPAAAG
ncbi:MAG TPA: cell wall hydrolase [Caulobacteraceae bacterium]|jgi:spore germination cell wall hydrolase CwlJ-like protein